MPVGDNASVGEKQPGGEQEGWQLAPTTLT